MNNKTRRIKKKRRKTLYPEKFKIFSPGVHKNNTTISIS
jgi:hypothetical protein